MPKSKVTPISKKHSARILETARESFGFQSLRTGQEEAISAVLDGQDTLVVQPTGSGKSAIYQIAGLLIEGSTVVISPLIALQKDQVDSINSQDAGEAVLVNSTQRVAESRESLGKIEERSVEYIFLAPEQLRNRTSLKSCSPPTYRSSWLMKRTVSVNGGTTSVRTICNWAPSSNSLGILLFWP